MAARNAGVALCLSVCALAVGSCGDDDDEPARVNHVVPEQKVRAYATSGRLGKVTRREVFKELKATPVSSRRALSKRDPKHPRRNRVRFKCYRFDVKGGKKGHFAELCFKNDRKLSSVLINSPGAGPPGGGGLGL